MRNSEFYNDLSSNYDEMINFERSLNNKTNLLRKFITPEHKLALDLGCGTGVDSIALSKLGLKVDAVDHSEGMLIQAKANSEKHKTSINFIKSSLTEYSVRDKRYDFVLSLGNTIANIDQSEVQKVFGNLKTMINIGGKILVQMINYAKLPKSGSYILNQNQTDHVTITRKYIIHQNHINFIIDRIDKNQNQQSQIVTKLYPHSVAELRQIAEDNNLNIKFFGDLKKETFFEDKSKNLVVTLTKK